MERFDLLLYLTAAGKLLGSCSARRIAEPIEPNDPLIRIGCPSLEALNRHFIPDGSAHKDERHSRAMLLGQSRAFGP